MNVNKESCSLDSGDYNNTHTHTQHTHARNGGNVQASTPQKWMHLFPATATMGSLACWLMPLATASMDDMGTCGECNKVKIVIHLERKGFKRSTSKTTNRKNNIPLENFVVELFSWGRPTIKITRTNIYLQQTFCLSNSCGSP